MGGEEGVLQEKAKVTGSLAVGVQRTIFHKAGQVP